MLGDVITHVSGVAITGLEDLKGHAARSSVAVRVSRVANAATADDADDAGAVVTQRIDINFNAGPKGELYLVVEWCGGRSTCRSLKVVGMNDPPPSVALIYELAIQLHGINNKQCESTQWLTKSDRDILRPFLAAYALAGAYKRSDLWNLDSSTLRRSVVRLLYEAQYDGPNGHFLLHPAAVSMLNAMVTRSQAVHDAALVRPARVPVAPGQGAPYDPCSGMAYHFTASGQQLYLWPRFINLKSDAKSACNKPDWMQPGKKGSSHGILTTLCVDSGVVVGTTFLTGHEGCKDAGAALYSYHPLLALESVVCDTPCMHATYMNTRAGCCFDAIKWTGDRFHVGAHTCHAIYDPSEYSMYDHVNTSMVEQWHAIMSTLTKCVKGSTLPHAMLLLQTLQDDHYLDRCTTMQYPESSRVW